MEKKLQFYLQPPLFLGASNCHWPLLCPPFPPGVQVEKEAVEVATDTQGGGNNLCGEDQESHDNENIEEVVCFPTSQKQEHLKKS